MTDINQLKKRRRELFGATISIPFDDQREDMAIQLKLALQGKPVTPRNILIARMETALDHVPEPYKPFAAAVLELFKAQTPQQ